MYRGRPCWGSNLDCRRANRPLWPLNKMPGRGEKRAFIWRGLFMSFDVVYGYSIVDKRGF
jgi:hypothetical protein